jgi:hypothetical protein
METRAPGEAKGVGWAGGGRRGGVRGGGRGTLLAAAATAILCTAEPAFAGAWTEPAGTGQVIVTTLVTEGEQTLILGGATVTQHYRKAEADAYLEYGLTDWLTVVVAPDFQAASISVPAASYDGLGQSAIGARARIWHTEASVFSFQALVAVPPRWRPVNAAEIGATDFQSEARLLAGRSFRLGTWTGFADAEIAYRSRGGAPANELHLDLTLGLRPAPSWLVMLQSFSTLAVGPARPPFLEGSEHKLELSLVYDLGRSWSVQFGGIATVAGHNMMRQTGAVAAVWRRF